MCIDGGLNNGLLNDMFVKREDGSPNNNTLGSIYSKAVDSFTAVFMVRYNEHPVFFS